MGVFYGGSGRSIGQNSSFLDSTAPTHRVNDVAITVATLVIQYATSINASSIPRYAQTSM